MDFGLMQAYKNGILGYPKRTNYDAIDVAFDACDTIDANIRLFLRDKSHTMPFSLENASIDFGKFWSWIGAEGDYQAALAQWQVKTNTSEALEQRREMRSAQRYLRISKKIGQILASLPMYFRNA
jgi:hypothetical protein